MAAPTRRLTALLIPGALLLGAAATVQEPFPHDAHERLFPLCEGCHTVETDDPADLYPDPALCGRCHDGDQAPTVTWSPPTGAPEYRHPDHDRLAGVALACQDCHAGGGAVALAEFPASCDACHGDHHTPSARCRVCHGPVVRAEHDHAAHAGCAECHGPEWVADLEFNRELCLVCHQELVDHKPGRSCGQCHAVGQPGA